MITSFFRESTEEKLLLATPGYQQKARHLAVFVAI